MLTGERLLMAALFLGAATASAAAQDDEGMLPGSISGNVAITSDYVFRGFTQTREDVAVQVGIDWDSDTGVYVGAWGSNIRFGLPDEGNFEGRLYGGYKAEIEGFTYDVGAIWYQYPYATKALEYDWWEASGKVGYDFGVAAVSGSVSYTPDYFGGLDKAWYYEGKLAVPVGVEGLSVDGTIGRQDFQGGIEDVTDYSVGVTYAMKWFTTDLRFIDTDGEAVGCKRICDKRVVLKLSRSF